MTSPSTHVIEGIVDAFSFYVFSGMPAHLIHVPGMRLVDRDEVFNMYKPVVESITEDELKKFSGSSRNETLHKVLRDKVKFATLSHRWLDTGEPTFQDMSESQKDLSENPGYHKLTYFCERAGEYDCELAWSDTCCINKESSAELDEAIQAMFNWYHNAAICIAYLACSSSVSDFAQEPWFTRGWTLQELLAPEKMKFYGKNWEPLSDNLDDKHPRNLAASSGDEISTPITPSQPDILTTITHLTEIESHDLISFSRGIHNVHQRLRWASRRTTTRVEDMAYSLIGIFDISMPITYGEGRAILVSVDGNHLATMQELGGFRMGRRMFSNSTELNKTLDMGRVEGIVGETPPGLRGDHAFAMTRHGVQMKLPLLDVVFDRPNQLVTIHGHTSGYFGRSKPWDLPVRVTRRRPKSKAETYRLGIVNYSLSGLARRNQYEIREGPLLCFFFTLDPNGRSWLRLQTENVILIDHKGAPVQCRCSFETVYI